MNYVLSVTLCLFIAFLASYAGKDPSSLFAALCVILYLEGGRRGGKK